MKLIRLGGAAAAAGLAWGHFEAGWVRLQTLPCPLQGLPAELEGLRIAHLSDFHLGIPSRGQTAVERAVEWVEERQPDLTLITGDLLSRPTAEGRLRELVARLPRCFAVLGNHDYAHTRDPFSHPAGLVNLEPATLLADDSRTIELRGKRPAYVPAAARTSGAVRRSGRRPADPPLPFPERRRPHSGRRLRPRAGGPPARRPDLLPLAGRPLAARAHPVDVHPGAVPPTSCDPPPLGRPGHDVRAVPLSRQA